MSHLSFPTAPSAGYPSFPSDSSSSDGDSKPSLKGQTSSPQEHVANRGAGHQDIAQNDSFNQSYDATSSNTFDLTGSSTFDYATGSNTFDTTGSSTFDYTTGSNTLDTTGSSTFDYSTGSNYYDTAADTSNFRDTDNFSSLPSASTESDQRTSFQGARHESSNVRQEAGRENFSQPTNLHYNTNLPPQAGLNQNSGLGQTATQVGQSINNQDITQNFAATQGFGTSSTTSTLSNLSNSTQNISSDQTTVSDSGLTLDQQVTSQHSGNQQSNSGSGGDTHSDHSGRREAGFALGPKPSSTTVMTTQRGLGGALSSQTILSQLGKPGQAIMGQQVKSSVQYQNPLQLSHSATSYISSTFQTKVAGLGLGALSLKIDPKVTALQTVASKVQTLSFINENKAPKLPPAPNVYTMVETSAELSTNVSDLTLTGMIAATDGMNAIEASEFASQITDINNAISSSHHAHHKGGIAKAFGWAMNVSMIVVGTLLIASGVGAGLGAALIIGGVLGCIMMSSAGTQLTNALTASLIKMGVPKKDAAIVAQVIICVIMIAATAGAGGAITVGADVLTEASAAAVAEAAPEIAAETATEASEESTATATNQTIKASAESISEDASNISRAETLEETAEAAPKKMPPLKDVWAALQTDAGYNAFKASLQTSLSNAPEALLLALGSSIMDSPQNAMDAVTKAAQSTSDMISQMTESFSLFAERTATSCRALLEGGSEEASSVEQATTKSTFAEMSASAASKAADQMKALASSLNVFNDPIRAALQAAELSQIALGVGSGVTQYQAAQAEAAATKAQAIVQKSMGETTYLQSQIQISMTQINELLRSMNSEITTTMGTLAGMSSSNPLSNLPKSA